MSNIKIALVKNHNKANTWEQINDWSIHVNCQVNEKVNENAKKLHLHFWVSNQILTIRSFCKSKILSRVNRRMYSQTVKSNVNTSTTVKPHFIPHKNGKNTVHTQSAWKLQPSPMSVLTYTECHVLLQHYLNFHNQNRPVSLNVQWYYIINIDEYWMVSH